MDVVEPQAGCHASLPHTPRNGRAAALDDCLRRVGVMLAGMEGMAIHGDSLHASPLSHHCAVRQRDD